MRKHRMYGLLAAIGLMAVAKGAYAQQNIVPVNCAGNPGALSNQFANGGQANTTYNVTGPCAGDFTVRQGNITIQADPRLGSPQTIINSINIGQTLGATIIGLGPGGGVVLSRLIINGSSDFEFAAVAIAAPAAVSIEDCTVQNSLSDGIAISGPALLRITHSTVQNNTANGLHAQGGADIESEANTITGNGEFGIFAERSSTVNLNISDTISQNSAAGSPAIVAQGSSSVRIVDVVRITGPSNNHTVLVQQGSSAFIEGATIAADTPFDANNPLAVIAVERSSTVTLAGGNTITNSAAGGAAVIVSAGSTLVEENGVSNTVNGDGRVNTQSVIELGAEEPGAFGGGLTWNGNVVVRQASSFVADGNNVTINGTLTLGQAANGYFNHSAGTTNDITKVVCNSTTDHVSNPTLVTPPITIGPPPGCQLF